MFLLGEQTTEKNMKWIFVGISNQRVTKLFRCFKSIQLPLCVYIYVIYINSTRSPSPSLTGSALLFIQDVEVVFHNYVNIKNWTFKYIQKVYFLCLWIWGAIVKTIFWSGFRISLSKNHEINQLSEKLFYAVLQRVTQLLEFEIKRCRSFKKSKYTK